jgi:hypothetical protein
MGVAAAWLGLIEGVSDGLSSFAKMASGYYTDQLRRRMYWSLWGFPERTRSVRCESAWGGTRRKMMSMQR